jgi:sulfatase modifying factor 1
VECDFDSEGFRLPTEAEWECAAGAGELHPYAGSERAPEVGWYEENSDGTTHPVGQKLPNAWGLHDMSGNVSEWVWDGYGAYPAQPQRDPRGPPIAAGRVHRGGAWNMDRNATRAACRSFAAPNTREPYVGFRLARTVS